MADIPGLIEGAHEGAGLGFEFLRHIERTRIIVHILDMMPVDGSDPAENYRKIRQELALYSKALAKKKEVIVANKIDLNPESKIAKELTKKLHKQVFAISAATGIGVKELSELLWKKVRKVKTESDSGKVL
jgi:GTP-binding protein